MPAYLTETLAEAEAGCSAASGTSGGTVNGAIIGSPSNVMAGTLAMRRINAPCGSENRNPTGAVFVALSVIAPESGRCSFNAIVKLASMDARKSAMAFGVAVTNSPGNAHT